MKDLTKAFFYCFILCCYGLCQPAFTQSLPVKWVQYNTEKKDGWRTMAYNPAKKELLTAQSYTYYDTLLMSLHSDIYFRTLNPDNGELIHERKYDADTGTYSFIMDMALTQNGGYVYGGYASSDISFPFIPFSKGITRSWIEHIDEWSNKVWTVELGMNVAVEKIKPLQDKGFIVGGTLWGKNELFPGWYDTTTVVEGGIVRVAGDVWLAKLDSAGTIEWHIRLGGKGDDIFGSLVFDPDDETFVMAGTSHSGLSEMVSEASTQEGKYWVVKLDKSGHILWQNRYGGSHSDEWVQEICLSPEGRYVVSGTTRSTDGDVSFPQPGSGSDCWLLFLGKDGEVLEDYSYGGMNDVINLGMLPVEDGSYWLFNTRRESTKYRPWFIKIDSTGIIETERYPDLDDYSLARISSVSHGSNTTFFVGSEQWLLALSDCRSIVVGNKISICEGQAYDFYEQSISDSGSYIHVFKTEAGCDSTISTRLSVNPLPRPKLVSDNNILSTNARYAQYEWFYNNTSLKTENNTLQAARTGYYRVAVTDHNACSDTSASYFQAVPILDPFEPEGRYVRKSIKPDTGEQVSVQEYHSDHIDYRMTAHAHANEYTMNMESYDAEEGRWVGVGSGGSPIAKDGLYYVLFFRDYRGDSVLVYKHECKNREEAYTFAYPAVDDSTSDHGWNWYIRDQGTGLYSHNKSALIHLYPNPVETILEIRHPFSNIVSIQLLDTYGRILKETSGSAHVDMSTFSSGVYILLIYENNVVQYTGRILKH